MFRNRRLPSSYVKFRIFFFSNKTASRNDFFKTGIFKYEKLTSVFSVLQADLASQYIKSAVKNTPTVFLMTDSQVAEEQFLVLINDLLASGEIPGLFQDDEVENIISSMRPQVKSLGMQDTRENCWKYFIDKVRKQLKVGRGFFFHCNCIFVGGGGGGYLHSKHLCQCCRQYLKFWLCSLWLSETS